MFLYCDTGVRVVDAVEQAELQLQQRVVVRKTAYSHYNQQVKSKAYMCQKGDLTRFKMGIIFFFFLRYGKLSLST